MSRPATGRRIDVRRSQIYGGSGPVAPYASDLIHAWYADREIVLATGVAAWGDAVGTSDFAQADTSKQPAYGVFTTKPALVFDDVNDSMATPLITLAAQSQITIAFSARWLGAGSGMLLETSANVGTNPGAFYVYENLGAYQIIYRNAASNLVRSAVIAPGVRRMVVTFDVVGASGIPTLYVDGASSGAAPAAANVGFSNQILNMGMRAGTSEPWGGKMGDVLMYGRALTVGEIAVVDAWLAARCV